MVGDTDRPCPDGQRQRIAIATRPDEQAAAILIFVRRTSSLDYESERIIQTYESHLSGAAPSLSLHIDCLRYVMPTAFWSWITADRRGRDVTRVLGTFSQVIIHVVSDATCVGF